MKKIISSIAVLFLMAFSVNAVAQKSVAFINTKTANQMVDEKTVNVTLELNNINDEKTSQKFLSSFKSAEGVHDVKMTTETGNKAIFAIRMPKAGSLKNVQAMLQKAGVETVNVDGENVAIAQFVEFMKGKKADKK
jgi:hypothetical protein